MAHISLSWKNLKNADVDVIAVAVSSLEKEGILSALDDAFDGVLIEQMELDGFEAKSGKEFACLSWGSIGGARLLVLGADSDVESARSEGLRLAALAANYAQKVKAKSVAFLMPSDRGLLPDFVQGSVLGVSLASYHFEHYFSEKKNKDVADWSFLLPGRKSIALEKKCNKALETAEFLASGVLAARDLVNEPPNVLNPSEFASRAKKMAKKTGLDYESLNEKEMKRLGMNLFLAVSSGSVEPARLICLTYKPKGEGKKNPVLALVGKGVTFDSGGLSLKPTPHMLNMHTDMAGAAAVFGAMKAIAKLKPSVEVRGYIAASENMTGAAAYRLNDVIRAHNGKTVEIKNTDAEGRLVLADTLSYACEQGATEVIDLATLTGACLVALGSNTAAAMGNQQKCIDGLLEAAKQVDESMWQLPLLGSLKEGLKSDVADLSNVGERYGGAISAGLFLQSFVSEGVDWTHLDIAGPAFVQKPKGHIKKGGTGYGVMTLVEYISSRY